MILVFLCPVCAELLYGNDWSLNNLVMVYVKALWLLQCELLLVICLYCTFLYFSVLLFQMQSTHVSDFENSLNSFLF